MRSSLLLVLCLMLAGCQSNQAYLDKLKLEQQRQQRHPYTLSSGGELRPEYQSLSIQHADLAFKLLVEQKAIKAEATLRLVSSKPLSQLRLDLDSTFDLEWIIINGIELPSDGFGSLNGQLYIHLPEAIQHNKIFDLTIAYQGVPLEAVNPPWQGGFIWQHTESGQAWVSTAVQGEGCDLFWPCIDHPLREPEGVSISITVPEPLVAVANGKFLGKQQLELGWNTYRWFSATQINTYAVSINVGPFELLQDKYHSRYGNNIDLQYWHLAEHRQSAESLFAQFSQYLEFFEQLIGPYPFATEKMGVVDTPYLGMEHQTMNAYGNHYQVDRYGFDWLLHHEFAHEWFGNQLTYQNPDDMWLHEGYGSYMQALYAQYLHGDAVYYEYLQQYRRAIINKAAMVSGRSMTEHQVYVNGPATDIYNKGALFLHTLRYLIGDQAFFNATRRLVYGIAQPLPGNFKPRLASTVDLLHLVNQQTNDNYQWLFEAYLYHRDLPELVVNRVGDRLRLHWSLKSNLDFPMPVELSVDGRLIRVQMQGNQAELTVANSAVVIVDPSSKILREQPFIDAYRDAQWKQQYNNTTLN